MPSWVSGLPPCCYRFGDSLYDVCNGNIRGSSRAAVCQRSPRFFTASAWHTMPPCQATRDGLLCTLCRCREGRATVQGAVSAAAAVAMAQAQRFERRLPQTLLMQCPANMRRQAGPSPGGLSQTPQSLGGAI